MARQGNVFWYLQTTWYHSLFSLGIDKEILSCSKIIQSRRLHLCRMFRTKQVSLCSFISVYTCQTRRKTKHRSAYRRRGNCVFTQIQNLSGFQIVETTPTRTNAKHFQNTNISTSHGRGGTCLSRNNAQAHFFQLGFVSFPNFVHQRNP